MNKVIRTFRGPKPMLENEIVVRLNGGMGNQMFQYAMGLATSIRLGSPLKLNVDSFIHDPMRLYTLSLWEGVKEPVGGVLIEPTIKEQGMPFNSSLVDSLPKRCSLDGYWQTEKYFFSIKEELYLRFRPKKPLTDRGSKLAECILNEEERSVFLTIRRTDYLQSNYHGVLGMDYYLAALRYIADRIKDIHVFVFSDDPEWVLSEFKIPHRMTVGGNFDRSWGKYLGREDEELYLMGQCNSAIMANSSYSWWGAWLTEVPGKIVIAPKQWFLNSPEDPRDIVPDRWIKL